MPKFGAGAPKCHACAKSVYAAEELKGLGFIWHKMCFKCEGCEKRLESGKETEHDDKPYCKNCHGKKFGPKGVGLGATAGCLSTEEEVKKDSKYKNPNAVSKVMSTGDVETCVTCNTTVYAAEKMIVISKIYHKRCIKCASCEKVLDAGSVLEHGDNIYCQNCYGKEFGPEGVGFGMGAGCCQSQKKVEEAE